MRYIPIITAILLLSCTTTSNKEKLGFQEVANFYICDVIKNVGFENKNLNNVDYIELELSNSDLLNNDIQFLTEHAGNAAYLFYSKLGDEKDKFDEIRIKFNLNNGQRHSYKFTNDELQKFETIKKEVDKTNEYLILKDYEKLAQQFDEVIGVNNIELKSIIDTVTSKYGDLLKIQFQGYRNDSNEKFGDFILVKEAFIVEKLPITMFLAYSKENNKLIGFHFP